MTLQRSPTFTNSESEEILKGSLPARRQAGKGSTGTRGAYLETASAMALIWSGLVPQQPPTIFRKPDSANS